MQSQYGKRGCPQMCYSVRVRPTLICMRLKSELAQHSLDSCLTGSERLTCTTTSFSRRWISMYSRKAGERHSPAAKIFQSGAPATYTKRCRHSVPYWISAEAPESCRSRACPRRMSCVRYSFALGIPILPSMSLSALLAPAAVNPPKERCLAGCL